MSELVLNSAVRSCCGMPRGECSCNDEPTGNDVRFLTNGLASFDYVQGDADPNGPLVAPPSLEPDPLTANKARLPEMTLGAYPML